MHTDTKKNQEESEMDIRHLKSRHSSRTEAYPKFLQLKGVDLRAEGSD